MSKLYYLALATFFVTSGCVPQKTNPMPDALISSNDFSQLSDALIQDRGVNLSSVESLVNSSWFSSSQQRVDFFTSNSLPSPEGAPLTNAGRLNANTLINSLFSYSLNAASAIDEKKSKKSFGLAILATEKLMPLYSYGPNKSCSFTNLAAMSTLKEADETLEKFPPDAKKWSWFIKTKAAVSSARKQIEPIKQQMLVILSSQNANTQWSSFCPASSQNMTAALDLVYKASQ